MITLLLKKLAERVRKLPAHREMLDRVGHKRYPIEIEGPEGLYAALIVNNVAEITSNPMLVVVPTEKEAESLVADFNLIDPSVDLFRWSGVAAYSASGAAQEIIAEQNRVLRRLYHGESSVVVTPLRAALSPLSPPEEFGSHEIVISMGDSADPRELGTRLSVAGYLRVPRVSVHGEYAQRGEVVDVFPPGDTEPYRIVFDFDEVSRISRFDALTQASQTRISTAHITPFGRAIWTSERLAQIRLLMESMRSEETDETIRSLEAGGQTAYEHLLFAASFDRPFTLFDYLDDNAIVAFVHEEHLQAGYTALVKEHNELYAAARSLRAGFVPQPKRILRDFVDIASQHVRSLRFPAIRSPSSTEDRIRFPYEGPHSYFGNVEYLKTEVDRMHNAGYEILVCSDSEAQKLRIEHLFSEEQLTVLHASVSHGFAIPELKIAIIQEDEIFGRRKRRARSVNSARSVAIDTFVELNPGDYVVHINYGIGRFHGVERVTAVGTERDYVQIEYAEEESIFVPIEQVNLVQRYIGQQGNEPRLDRIGGKAWEARKSRVRKSVEDLAERLIALYSKRKLARGFAFPADSDWQLEFEADFPFEETPDQIRCIEEVKIDMEKPEPMDRLICGDVGYGKTEVAMRAAFKAVTGGKQVAMLAPTTILVEQHYERFGERFGEYPVRSSMLSRFVGRSDQRKILEMTSEGETDIVIGTHRLLQKDVSFKNLGLIIIDEEQRFGVKDKERLKEWKTSVDCLTLTATPIPRTLHMSLLKIRDMSLLKTPPYNRRPIETIIREFDEEIVAEAIRSEMQRGGQIFFLHNRVETLENISRYVSNIVPEALVETAHGQMRGDQLEEVMHRFVHGGFHVLVSTTIIENGIDIPNVNTIIIDRADMYGISQLYQLRGRVGRSDRIAYAFLLYPEERALSEIAMKRLQVISDHTELGSGFQVALKDLEVRGAGNLLGRQQHGDILSVGFDMYVRMLDKAVAALSDEKRARPVDEVFLELEYSGYIPDEYIDEAAEKMEIYKKIAGITTEEELESLLATLEDRFGPIPDNVQSLLSLAEIRILCGKLNISSLRERSGDIRIEFGRIADLAIDRVMRLIRDSGGKIRPDPKHPNVLIIAAEDVGLAQKSEYLRERLVALL